MLLFTEIKSVSVTANNPNSIFYSRSGALISLYTQDDPIPIPTQLEKTHGEGTNRFSPETHTKSPIIMVLPNSIMSVSLRMVNTLPLLPSEFVVSPKSDSLRPPMPAPSLSSSKARTKSILRTPSRKNSSGSGLALPKAEFCNGAIKRF